MNILVLGSGGREHALQYIIAKSKRCNQVYVSAGNGGTENNVAFANLFEMRFFIQSKEIDLVVVGSDELLAAGVVDVIDDLTSVIGPRKKAARLEWDKLWAKSFMARHQIPTPQFSAFSDHKKAVKFLESVNFPVVIKASGLAAGKGVIIANTSQEAIQILDDIMFVKKLGSAGNTVLIEEFITGIELSYFVLIYGDYSYAVLPEAMDYKQIGEQDKGVNTGGMGAISPVPFCNDELKRMIVRYIVEPTITGLRSDGIVYSGFIYFGLMIKSGKPYLLEYNCRLGDPEAQVILPRISSDFLDLLCGNRTVAVENRFAVGVVLSSEGYPQSPKFGDSISGLESADLVFHAGTKKNEREILTSGGRVITVVGQADYLTKAREKAYSLARKITFDGKYYRKDIGQYRLE